MGLITTKSVLENQNFNTRAKEKGEDKKKKEKWAISSRSIKNSGIFAKDLLRSGM